MFYPDNVCDLKGLFNLINCMDCSLLAGFNFDKMLLLVSLSGFCLDPCFMKTYSTVVYRFIYILPVISFKTSFTFTDKI